MGLFLKWYSIAIGYLYALILICGALETEWLILMECQICAAHNSTHAVFCITPTIGSSIDSARVVWLTTL